MTTKQEACPTCNAEYKIRFVLDKDYYKPSFCAFCGDPIADEEYEADEPEDE